MIQPADLRPNLQPLIDDVCDQMAQRPKLTELFQRCYPNTLMTTMRLAADGTTFVVTGDIPAMWLRDSTAQVRPYLLPAATDPQIAAILAGVVRRQLRSILLDPYANAFNETANGAGFQDDLTATHPAVWERKYEIDSLCYPLQLAYLLWQATGQTNHLDAEYEQAVRTILALWTCEQQHMTDSPYQFQRRDCPPTDTLPNEGWGAPIAPTGMTWSGFRPSDDACTYGYLIPANMFAVVVLGYVATIARTVHHDERTAAAAETLAAAIERGIREYAIVDHPEFGPIYAYETDGMGHYVLMDDANIPSLLALPYLGYCSEADPIYRNTRAFVLSAANPYFYQGRAAQGIGSPHTSNHHIWPLALAMQGLTTSDQAERDALLDLLAATDADTGLMHESFHADDPQQFTRPWFGWANALFSELVLAACGLSVPGIRLAVRE